MHRQQKYMLRLGSREERGPEDWPALEIERLPVVALDLRLKLSLCRTRRVDDVQRDLAVPPCDLNRSGRAILIDRPQLGVTIDQCLNGVTHYVKGHPRSEPHRHAQVVGSA